MDQEWLALLYYYQLWASGSKLIKLSGCVESVAYIPSSSKQMENIRRGNGAQTEPAASHILASHNFASWGLGC